ncbi:hypothetical protein ACOBQX_22260 [Actinokineospora sp. G85]|uniref:hypothetical protein n=1 Tax=Actinokineospora sp. G85 TaxID=3406626 RepID=UPI003C77BEB8
MGRKLATALVAAAVALVPAVPGTAAAGPARDRVWSLPLPEEATGVTNLRITGSGLVYGHLGHADGTPHVAVWQGGGPRELAPGAVTSFAYGANGSGLVVGQVAPADAEPGYREAVAWLGGRTIDLAPEGSTGSAAVGVNDRGEVLVYSVFTPGPDDVALPVRIAVWHGGRVARVLYEGPEGTGIPLLGPAGHVAVVVPNTEGASSLRVWDPRGALVADTPQPTPYAVPFLLDLNSRGEVVMQSALGALGRVLLWQGGAFTDIGLLPGAESTDAHPTDFFLRDFINDAGEVVATSRTGATSRAFRWKNGKATPLTPDPASYPQAINERGDVALMTCPTPTTCTPQLITRTGPRAATGPTGTTTATVNALHPHAPVVVGTATTPPHSRALPYVRR